MHILLNCEYIRNKFYETRIYFLIKDEIFAETYNEICEKVSNIIKKQFNSDPVHNNKHLNAEKINAKESF